MIAEAPRKQEPVHQEHGFKHRAEEMVIPPFCDSISQAAGWGTPIWDFESAVKLIRERGKEVKHGTTNN